MGRAFAVMVAVGALSCADDEGPGVASSAGAAKSYAGAVEASDARVALVVGGEAPRAYVCGGERSYAALSRWFRLATVVGSPGAVRGEAEGWVLEGEVGEGEARGVLRSPEGAELRWQAGPAPSPMGLYELDSEFGKIGAVVQGPGPEVQGTLLGKGGYKAQVTPVRPLALPDNLWINVRVGDEPRMLRLLPLR